jgi:hypothetical protein
LNVALAKFDAMVAPSNYKRPTEVFSKKMIEDAEKTITELGYLNSLNGKYATVHDLSLDNIIFVDREIKSTLGKTIFDNLKDTVIPTTTKISKLDKIEEISIADFISKIVPTSDNIELLLDNNLVPNLMSLIAPTNKDDKSLLQWRNNFSWSYNGNVTDAEMKNKVSRRGGNVEGVLRCSLDWSGKANHDLDLHCNFSSPSKVGHLYYGNKSNSFIEGSLDVDIRVPRDYSYKDIVENIIFTNSKKLEGTTLTFYINQYSKGNVRPNVIDGFDVEIEFDGNIYKYTYTGTLSGNVIIAKVECRDGKFTIQHNPNNNSQLTNAESTINVWGVQTNTFNKVSVIVPSPNYWKDDVNVGSLHYFFMLQNCKNPDTPRRFFNEFLNSEIMTHKRVFEALGNRIRVPYSEDQLSGVGFIQTKRQSVIVKVTGKITRLLKINF